jgi:hypothetical protein
LVTGKRETFGRPAPVRIVGPAADFAQFGRAFHMRAAQFIISNQFNKLGKRVRVAIWHGINRARRVNRATDARALWD